MIVNTLKNICRYVSLNISLEKKQVCLVIMVLVNLRKKRGDMK